MQKCVKPISCTLMATAFALLGTPLAWADNDSFVTAAHALGFDQSPEVLIRNGQHACYSFQLGDHLAPAGRPISPEQIADHIMRYTSVKPDQAHQFLILSVNEYCPQYRDRVGA